MSKATIKLRSQQDSNIILACYLNKMSEYIPSNTGLFKCIANNKLYTLTPCSAQMEAKSLLKYIISSGIELQARSDWSGQGLTTFGPPLTFDLSIQCY